LEKTERELPGDDEGAPRPEHGSQDDGWASASEDDITERQLGSEIAGLSGSAQRFGVAAVAPPEAHTAHTALQGQGRGAPSMTAAFAGQHAEEGEEEGDDGGTFNINPVGYH